MLRHSLTIALVATAVGCGGPAAPAPEVAEAPDAVEVEPVKLDDLSQLAWLVGHWSGDDCKGTVSEQWLAVLPRLMLGTNRTEVGDALRSYEHIEIEAREEGVVYRVLPESQAAVEFRLVELEEARAVFQNPTHDFPRRISYRLDGETLVAEVVGEIDGVPSERSWAWQKQADAAAPEPIRKSAEIAAAVEDVFAAFTKQDEAVKFFAPQASIQAEPSGRYELYFALDQLEGNRGSEGCTIVEIEPPGKLVFTWNFPPTIPTLRSAHGLVTLTFSAAGEGKTQIELVHDGFHVGGDWDEGRAYFERAWGVVLERLGQRFTSGPIDWDAQ